MPNSVVEPSLLLESKKKRCFEFIHLDWMVASEFLKKSDWTSVIVDGIRFWLERSLVTFFLTGSRLRTSFSNPN